MCRTIAAASLVLALLRSTVALAQEPPAAGSPAGGDVKQAIARAIEYLKSMQDESGRWTFERDVRDPNNAQATPRVQEDATYHLGLTALAGLALVENGVLPSDAAIQKAYAYVKEGAANNTKTYNLGLSILFLTRLGSREDRTLVQRLARRLMLGQLDSGGWPYDCPVDADRESQLRPLQGHTRKSGEGDNSNTQFAIMGLWASTRAGVQVHEPLELVAKRFRQTQAPSGGWDYKSTGTADTNAMTTAGVYALTVSTVTASRKAAGTATSAAKSKTQATESTAAATSPRAILAEDAVFQKALTRVEQFAAGINPGSSPYYLWSVERLGVTLQMPKFGKVDWYALGKKALLESQKSNGAWELAWKGPADTSFGLLFLKKANLGRDISYALSGDASKPFVVLGDGPPTAFAKLQEAIAAAKDGGAIEVMGHGPFEVAGIWLDQKSLTIRGGEGFEPTLVHTLDLLENPEREPHFRALFGARQCTLTLEGLRVQMDPEPRRKAVWAAVAGDNATVRAVNCSFSQTNTAAVTGIELTGASRALLQNCTFSGFARAVEIIEPRDASVQLENCLVYSRVALAARDSNPSAKLSAQFTRNTLHVGEIVQLGELAGAAEFDAEANIFHTPIFSNAIRPAAASPATRKWNGRQNVFDLTRWLASAGQPVREVRDLDSWRKYWNTTEEGSLTRSVPFTVRRQLGPFRHQISPNDWRLTVETLHDDHDASLQIGCDVYLVGAGEPYFQFTESMAYDAWRSGVDSAALDQPAANGAAPAEELKKLDGTWLPVSAELDGQKLPDAALTTFKLIIQDGRYTVLAGDTMDRGTLRLDTAAMPRSMDIAGSDGPNKGKTILSIYELSGDELKVCYAPAGGNRPTEFESKPGTKLFLVHYRREKPQQKP